MPVGELSPVQQLFCDGESAPERNRPQNLPRTGEASIPALSLHPLHGPEKVRGPPRWMRLQHDPLATGQPQPKGRLHPERAESVVPRMAAASIRPSREDTAAEITPAPRASRTGYGFGLVEV